MNETLDGDYQTFRGEDGGYIREHFFGKYPETKELVADLTDEQIFNPASGWPRRQEDLRSLQGSYGDQGQAHRHPGTVH